MVAYDLRTALHRAFGASTASLEEIMAEERPSAEAALDEFYASLEVAERDALRRSDDLLGSVEEDDAAATFRKGDALLLARAAVARGHFLKWCALKWKYHWTYAYSFMKVAEQLAPLRNRLVSARVDRSALFELASRPEKAEEVVAVFERGDRLTVAEVQTMIGTKRTASAAGVSPDDVGGLDGLRLLHAAKRKQLRSLAERFGRIVDAIEAALAAPRVMKGELAAAINLESRWARAELYNLCAFIEPAGWDPSKPAPAKFAEGSGWDRTDRMLDRLGWPDGWPPKGEMGAWLLEQVLPVLKWAASGEPNGAESGNDRENSGTDEAPDGGMSVTAERDAEKGQEPPCDATKGEGDEGMFPFDADSIENGASFVAFLRMHLQSGGEVPDSVEAGCRVAATSLASIAKHVFPHDSDKKVVAAQIQAISDLFYQKSLTATPMEPPKGHRSRELAKEEKKQDVTSSHSLDASVKSLVKQFLATRSEGGVRKLPSTRPPPGER